MSLRPGMRFGPYEAIAPLGAGGMGEVYRARDTRLGRDVAIKVLPATFSRDPDRLRRFEQEARAASVLNHPNILTIYDIGTQDESPFVVCELLEGETLRERLKDQALSTQKALLYALQILHGLAAAHDKGIVHRDVKPENLFITKDGRVKVLDFGLAKFIRVEPAGPGASSAPTALASLTEPGEVLGTVGYMAPEQVRGLPADHRSDIFSFGAVLYEMLSGQRAFRGESRVEVMNAILKDEPPVLSAERPDHSPALDLVVRHCLEKNADERFQSAHDLAFAIESLLDANPTAAGGGPLPVATASRMALSRIALVGAVAVLIAAATAFWAGKRAGIQTPPSFQRLTFGRGTVWSARFAPEGRAVVYSASWEGKPVELFWTQPDSPVSRPLGFVGADILAISPSGEMALLFTGGSAIERGWKLGTLAEATLAGGAPRESSTGVALADWSRGSDLSVVRHQGGKFRVECPVGKMLYETADRIGALRRSPDGGRFAIAERPPGMVSGWDVALLELDGKKRILAGGWAGDFIDLAWSPSGEEIWFNTRQGGDGALHAVTLSGRQRLLARMGAAMQLFDVARDGRVLVGRTYWRSGIMGTAPGEREESDLSWLDASEVDDVSYDGRALLITEFGEGGGTDRWSVCLRRLQDGSAVRLGDGQGFALSPDGTRALAVRRAAPPQLVLWPVGAGDPIYLKNEKITDYTGADWLPDGNRVVFSGSEPGRGVRCYLQGTDGGPARAITPEGYTLRLGQKAVSPDGASLAATGPDGGVVKFPISGGEPQPIAGLQPWDVPIRWSSDEHSLFVFRKGESPPKVYLVDLSTGRNTVWKPVAPRDLAGIINIWAAHIGPDESSYYYSYMRNLSDLHLLQGLQ